MSTMIATRRVYPIGYSALGAQERIDALLDQPMTLLIDTRKVGINFLYKPIYGIINSSEYCLPPRCD
jgi:hypothetical protein